MSARINPGVTVGLTVLLVLAGCTTGVEPVPPEVDQAQVQFAEFLDATLEEDMSDAQRALLQKAADGEKIEYQDMELLIADTFECFEAAGIEYEVRPPQEMAPGLLMYGYTFGVPESDHSALAQADWCIEYHDFWASMAYQGQPSTIEALDREFDRHIPDMIECIRGTGVTMDDDATRAEVEAAINEALMAPNPEMCDYRAWS